MGGSGGGSRGCRNDSIDVFLRRVRVGTPSLSCASYELARFLDRTEVGIFNHGVIPHHESTATGGIKSPVDRLVPQPMTTISSFPSASFNHLNKSVWVIKIATY
jgi:hypothetical protein